MQWEQVKKLLNPLIRFWIGDNMSEIRTCEVYKKRSAIIMYLIGCIGLIFIGIYMYTYSGLLSLECGEEFRRLCFYNPLFYQITGQCIIGYFGVCIFVLSVSLFHPDCLFYCTKDGFWSKKYGYTNWKDVQTVSIENISTETVIRYKKSDSQNENILKFSGADTDITQIYIQMRNNL